ncbi:MAG: S16 family serine protease [Sulfolobales archaeon]
MVWPRSFSIFTIFIIFLFMLTPYLVYTSSISVIGYARVPALAVYMLENGSYVGSISWIEVKILAPGSGEVYVSTEPLSDIDLQASGRAAVLIASYLANIDPFKYDYLISIKASAPIVGGPSAGSAMVAAIFSALTNISLDPLVASTGMILPDGLIGPVGGVPEKVVAAASSGYKTILIPWGQSIYPETRYVRQSIGPISVIRPVSVNINVSDLASRYGARVVEVASAEDLLELFTRGAYQAPKELMSPYISTGEESILKSSYGNFTQLQERSASSANQRIGSIRDRQLVSLINSLLTSSERYRNESSALFERGLYYPALSMIFTSYTLARYAENIAGVFTAQDATTYTKNYISYVGSMLNSYRDLWRSLAYGKKGYSIEELYILPEIFRRLQDAEYSLNISTQLASSGNIVDSLYYASYAEARLRSIDTWLSLLGLGTDSMVNITYVERISYWIYSYAATSLAYLESLLSSLGYQLQSTQSLEDMLRRASTYLAGGDYIASISISTDIITNTTLTIHSMFSINVTGLADVVRREVMRVLSTIGGDSPISARLYAQMGDYLASSGEYQQAISFYEEALFILRISKLLNSQGISLNRSTAAVVEPTSTEVSSVTRSISTNTSTQIISIGGKSGETSSGANNVRLMSMVITIIAIAVVLVSVALAIYIYRRSRSS